ncbi:hypothetical protein, partial [Burkholderia contaminans]|uniref:hypothetical protein n=1 Tax=Burkholderia contaminans TaxID=488447 RepID=UPI003BFA12AA
MRKLRHARIPPNRNFFISFNALIAFVQTIRSSARSAFSISEMTCCRCDHHRRTCRQGFPRDIARADTAIAGPIESNVSRDSGQIIASGLPDSDTTRTARTRDNHTSAVSHGTSCIPIFIESFHGCPRHHRHPELARARLFRCGEPRRGL